MNDLSNNPEGLSERGLLDLSVALSTRDITAGKNFTIFVLIKNPFDKEAWIRQVDVSLPSELRLAPKQEDAQLEEKNIDKKSEIKKEADFLAKRLTEFDEKLDQISLKSNDSETLWKALSITSENIRKSIEQVSGPHKRGSTANISLQKGRLGNVKVYASTTNIALGDTFGGESNSDENLRMGNIEIFDPVLVEETQSKGGKISLTGSLPEDNALQPGSTTVYTAVLTVNSPYLFTPSQYRLQFNVQYSFEPKPQAIKGNSARKDRIFSNTISHEIAIRPSVVSMIVGGGTGGIVGSLSRVLQVNPAEEIQQFKVEDYYSSGISVVLSVILSCIAIIFMARKSDAQSFISVEDFWGGLLIGFLVGYTGTSFFQQLTGFSPDTEVEVVPSTAIPIPEGSE